MPKLDGILETAIHTEDMVRSRAFYEGECALVAGLLCVDPTRDMARRTLGTRKAA